MGTLRLVLCTLWWCVQEIKRKNLSSVSYCVLWIVSFWQCFECVTYLYLFVYSSNPYDPTKSHILFSLILKSAVPFVFLINLIFDKYLVNSAECMKLKSARTFVQKIVLYFYQLVYDVEVLLVFIPSYKS